MSKTFERILIEQCAPTLAGLKTGSMFSYQIRAHENINELIEYWNELLMQRGIRLTILARYAFRALIYVYRTKNLTSDLQDTYISGFLNTIGYDTGSTDTCIGLLKERIGNCRDFPHELGLFLGYPLHDVVGFIQNKGQNACCSGCWKVYCDQCTAQKCFARFKKCKTVYLDLFMRGKSILQLTVVT